MKKLLTGVLCMLCLQLAPVHAGNQAGSQAASQAGRGGLDLTTAARFGKQVERALAAKGARVAVVSRVGRERAELPDGIRYTHVAFAVYSQIKTADGAVVPGYAFYNLYQSPEQPERSSLVTDFATNFFMAANIPEAGVIIPRQELQQKLLRLIGTEQYRQLHNPAYSVIANPNNNARQNCTENVLDVLQSALYGTNDTTQIKANIQAYFEPQAITIDPFVLALGGLFSRDITTSDHQGAIATATFGSLNRYMQKYDLTQASFELKDEQQSPAPRM